jgi:glycosyltransferase involved in cell wall biosynthesis
MPKVSVVIITLNEEKNIRRCLESVKNIADEIVVVDSFSIDRTEEICREYGVKFIQNRFEDYVKQHSFADAQAKYDHIVCIDADEALSEELAGSIRIAKKYWNHDGYFMNRLTNYCGKWIHHSGWYPDKKLRLYDRRKGKWVGMKVHERFMLTTGATTGHLKGDLLHYSFYTIADHLRQIDNFSSIAATSLYEQGVKFRVWKLLLKPFARFIKGYIIRGGFLDGIYGYIIAKNSSYSIFLRFVKLWHLENQQGTQ